MNMNQDRHQRSRLQAIAFGKALRKGLMEDAIVRECFSNSPFSKRELKLQARMEKFPNEGCKEEDLAWQRESKLRAEASRRAFQRGLELGIKTE